MKGIAIIAVVLGHVLLGYGENDAFGEYNNFFWELKNWIYIWHMPLFLCLSGYSFCLAYYRNNELNKIKVKSQIINLILLYIIFSIVFYGLKIPMAMFTDNKMTLSDAIFNLIFPNTLMWYLWVLSIYYIVLLCFKFVKKMLVEKPLIILVILLIATYVQRISATYITWRLCFENLIHGAFYFCLGMVLCFDKKKVIVIRRACVGVGMGIVILHFISFMNWSETLDGFNIFANEIIAILIILLMFVIAPKSHDTIRNGGLNRIGKASLVVYLFHTYIVTAMKVFSIKLGLCSGALMNIIIIIISTVFPIAICYLVDCLRRKSQIIGVFFAPGKLLKMN